MLRSSVYRAALVALPARTRYSERTAGALPAFAAAGTAAALTAIATVQQRQQRKPSACEMDMSSIGIGVGIGALSAIVIKMMMDDAKRSSPPSFEKRLKSAYTKNDVARAVLSDAPLAHPDLVKAAAVDQKNIHESGLAVANHIRSMWADILSEAFHYPKSFFIATKIGKTDDRFTNVKEGQSGISSSIGKYKVSIPLLKSNKAAVAMGVDKLAEAFDRNRDGILDFHEFATLILIQTDFAAEKQGHPKRSKSEILQLLYSVLDDDGDGKVTSDEFESFLVMCSKLGIAKQYDPKQYKALWTKYDQDGNGVLSYGEFVCFAREMLDLSSFKGEFPRV